MISDYVKTLVDITNDQYDKFRFESEDDVLLSQQIKKYWEDLEFDFPGVSTPWSAVFVSYCIKTAGATKTEFQFAQAHSKFVHFAIQNAVNDTGIFKAFDFNAVTPELGDIIQNNRNGNKFNFQFAKEHRSYESHSAIVVEKGIDANGHYALTIGGNESDSIRKKKVRLDKDMKIIQRSSGPYISVVRDLK
jgi:hypothetical protein